MFVGTNINKQEMEFFCWKENLNFNSIPFLQWKKINKKPSASKIRMGEYREKQPGWKLILL